MGFVIQLAAGKAEAGPRPGVLGPADNAAGGQLGAKTAIKIRGTRPRRQTRGSDPMSSTSSTPRSWSGGDDAAGGVRSFPETE